MSWKDPEARKLWEAKKLAEDPDYFRRKARQTYHRRAEAYNAARRKERAENPEPTRSYHRAWRERNRDKVREAARRCNALRAEALREYHERHATTPERRARTAVNRAVREGTLKKPKACEVCHAPTPSRSLHAHHYAGYVDPLVVRWMCAECHGKEHRKQ